MELSDKEFDEITEPLVQVVASLKARVKDLEEEVGRFRSFIDKGDLVFRYDMPADVKDKKKDDEALTLTGQALSLTPKKNRATAHNKEK